MIYSDTLELIGNTPLLEVKCFDTGLCRLFLKLDNQNPGGSIKDRIGRSMIEAAEREGKIKPGDTIIEATAGNTGLGLALTALKKGYRLLLVIPDKMSQEKVQHLKALGAEIVMTRSDIGKGDPEYYQDYAAHLHRKIRGSFYVDQFNNPANPLAHETSTGPEIWEQTSHQVDAVAVGVGSGGTLAGLTKFFKKVRPEVEFILGDPSGSVLKDYIETGKYGTSGSWLVEGIGEDFIPSLCDFDLVKKAYSITDAESFETVRFLLRKEGILAGSSSGTIISAALRYAREQKTAKNIVTFVFDTGSKYLSKLFNEYWMIDQGFIEKENQGDVLELVSRKFEDRAVVTAAPEDTLLTAYSRMRMYDISQLPVLKGNLIKGIIDESDILLWVTNHGEDNFCDSVEKVMITDIETVRPHAPVESVLPLLKKGLVPIVADNEKFYGLVTRIDFLNYLRRKLK